MIYYLTVLLLVIFSILHQSDLGKFGKLGVKILVVVSFIYFLFLGGLRFEVGADWMPYKDLFNRILNINDINNQREEPLYLLYSYLIKVLFNNYSVFIFLTFLISFYCKFKFIRAFSPDIFLSLIIYLYTIFLIYDINGLRQGVSLGLAMISVRYIIDRNIYKFLIVLITAILFHISAIIFIPFYFLSRIKIKNSTLIISLLVVVVLSISLRQILKNSQVFQAIIQINSLKHYSVYTTDNNYKLDLPILSVAVFQRLFIFSMFILTYKRINVEERIKLLFRNGYFIGIVIFLIFSFSSEFAARLSFYYKAFEIAMIPLVVYSFPKRYQIVSFLLLFTAFSIFGIYRLLSIPNGYLIPYNNLIFP